MKSPVLSLTLVLVFLSLSTFALAEPDLARLDKDNVIVEYPPDKKDLAVQIHEWLVQWLKDNGAIPQDDIKRFTDNQDEILAFVAKQLAMEKPGRALQNIFQQLIKAAPILAQKLPNQNHYILFERKALIERLENGEGIPGYTYDPETDKFAYAVEGSADEDIDPDSKPDFVPICYEDEKDDLSFSQARQRIEDMMRGINSSISALLVMGVRQSCDIGITYDLRINGPQLRWFSAGVSYYICSLITQEYTSARISDEILKKTRTEPYLDIKKQVKILSWRPSKEEKSEADQRLENARQAFAFQEIKGLVDRHGEDVLPKIFTELRKYAESREGVPDNQPLITSNAPIMDAIQTVTGENFRERLLAYYE